MTEMIQDYGLGPVHGGFLRRQDLEDELRQRRVPIEPGARIYTRGDLRVLIGKHPLTGRYHLSLSAADRDPSWQELKDARYTLLPKRQWMAQLLPPPDHYANLHPHTFHLYEVAQPPETI